MRGVSGTKTSGAVVRGGGVDGGGPSSPAASVEVKNKASRMIIGRMMSIRAEEIPAKVEGPS